MEILILLLPRPELGAAQPGEVREAASASQSLFSGSIKMCLECAPGPRAGARARVLTTDLGDLPPSFLLIAQLS